MEDAKITQNQIKEEPLYQQGRYPSIIDTDDLVFELGKQTVNHLNHEKLIGKMIKQIESLQRENLQLKSVKIPTDQKISSFEPKIKQFEDSNKLYEENNRKLGIEIVKLRDQITKKETLIGELNNKNEIIVNEYQQKLFDIIKTHEEEINQLRLKSDKKLRKKVITDVQHNTSA